MPNLRSLINDLSMQIYDYISEAIECQDMEQIEFDLCSIVETTIDEYKMDHEIED